MLRFFSILKKLQKGFALFEVSIALIIVGIIGSILFSMAKNAIHYKKSIQTQQSLELAMKSIGVHKAKNNRIPYAGEDGLEVNQLLIGKIPYKSLYIEKKYVCNGDGNILTYIVSPDAAFMRPNIILKKKDDNNFVNHSIRIIDEFGEMLTREDEEVSDFCAVVLISSPLNYNLSSFVYEDGSFIVVKIPPKDSGVSVAWSSYNNLDILNK